MSEPLHMVSAVLDLPTVFRRAGVRLDIADHGYSIHCTLASLFGDFAPRPFWPREVEGRRLRLLGYAPVPAQNLREHADAFADPQDHAACCWNRLASKQMPKGFPSGRTFAFEVRACPIVRLARAIEDSDERAAGALRPRTYSKGAELDVVQARRLSGDGDSSRDGIYGDWLAERFARGSADLIVAEVSRFSLARLWRRPQGGARKGRPLVRPDIQLGGRLRVRDSTLFTKMLASGVGRHSAFGFGMLLLRPDGHHVEG